jgi:hypothetical protein
MKRTQAFTTKTQRHKGRTTDPGSESSLRNFVSSCLCGESVPNRYYHETHERHESRISGGGDERFVRVPLLRRLAPQSDCGRWSGLSSRRSERVRDNAGRIRSPLQSAPAPFVSFGCFVVKKSGVRFSSSLPCVPWATALSGIRASSRHSWLKTPEPCPLRATEISSHP